MILADIAGSYLDVCSHSQQHNFQLHHSDCSLHLTGLDSTAATSLIQTLRRLANEQGKTIVAVIHQPSQHVFAQFDDLLLVSEGKQMYFGELDKVRSYMDQQLGIKYKAVDEMGTAEHVLDCISRRPIGTETPEQADARMQLLANAAVAAKKNHHDPRLLLGERDIFDSLSGKPQLAVISQTGPHAGIWTQFQLLLKRSMRELARGKGTLLIKLAQQVALSVIYGVRTDLYLMSVCLVLNALITSRSFSIHRTRSTTTHHSAMTGNLHLGQHSSWYSG
jgi:hypothetical protein